MKSDFAAEIKEGVIIFCYSDHGSHRLGHSHDPRSIVGLRPFFPYEWMRDRARGVIVMRAEPETP